MPLCASAWEAAGCWSESCERRRWLWLEVKGERGKVKALVEDSSHILSSIEEMKALIFIMDYWCKQPLDIRWKWTSCSQLCFDTEATAASNTNKWDEKPAKPPFHFQLIAWIRFRSRPRLWSCSSQWVHTEQLHKNNKITETINVRFSFKLLKLVQNSSVVLSDLSNRATEGMAMRIIYLRWLGLNK